MNKSETLISAPPKSSSSSSSWLHRLRSARGFPDSDDIDLEHFLSTVSQTSIPPPQPDHNLVTGKHVHTETETHLQVQDHDSITNFLSQLFHMGGGDFPVKTKKTSRKQHSPRICLAIQNQNQLKEPNIVHQQQQQQDDHDVDDNDDDWDVSAYSQTDVTVIDTSVASWKFEKVLYRRKNIWKLGNKKGKGLMSGDRNKRKECVSENADGHNKKFKLCNSRDDQQDGDKKKKLKKKKKKKKKKLNLCNSFKHVDRKDDMIQSNSAQHTTDESSATLESGLKLTSHN